MSHLTCVRAVRDALDLHNRTMNLERNGALAVDLWHLLASVRTLCRVEGIDAETLWKESAEVEGCD